MSDDPIETAKRPNETASLADPQPVKKAKNEDPSDSVERRRLEKEQKDAEKQALKEQKAAEKIAAKEKKELERKAEREQKELERKADKERKEAERLAEKARKDAEKQLEKERKEAEKAAEKEKKDAEKLAAKEKKEKELLKAQPRINLFFKASNTPSAPSSQSVPDFLPSPHQDVSSQGSVEQLSDYQRNILPFHVKQNGQLFSGSCNYTCVDEEEPKMDCKDWLRKHMPSDSIGNIKNKLTSQQFQTQLALAQESSQVANLLTHIRIRRLQFSHLSPKYIEDPSAPVNQEYRPPYVGSVRDVEVDRLKLLALNPFRTDLVDDISYDYDSEVEWDNEDGEDLRDDDGDDSDEDQEDQEELKEFLSSDDDCSGTPRKPRFLGPLTPIVIWGDDDAGASSLDPFAIELFDGPIVPLKGVADKQDERSSSKTDGSVKPEDPINKLPVSLSSVLDPLEKKVGRDKLKSSLVAHNGSTGTKTLIVELLKQQLPGATAQEIKMLFDSCVERVGKKRAEKKWVLNSKACEYFSLPGSEPHPDGGLEVFNFQKAPVHISHHGADEMST